MVREEVHYIDGPCLVSAFLCGAEHVASKRVHLNEINVFPVPDGDTGNNLAMTLKAAADALCVLENPSLGEACEAMSRAVLIGARGNAGIILAQILRGFAREAQGIERLYPRGFVEALGCAVEGAYEAMAEPVEGTILTVVRESVESVARLVDEGEEDFVALLVGMYGTAAESLDRTPDLLPVLKEAGVVDAGGEGFVDFLQGILMMLRGEEVESVLHLIPSASPVAALGGKERDLKYRYCTEFMLEGPKVDVGDVKVRLVGMGGSLVVVGSPGLIRVHIHSNAPEDVFAAAGELGELSRRKVDDMREQHREFIRGAVDAGGVDEGPGDGHECQRTAPVGATESEEGVRGTAGRRRGGRDRRARGVRIVTDSSADLSDEDISDLGITVVPLTISFGDGNYRCGVDLTSAEFYERLEGSWELPTTSQPTPHDFLQTYEELGWETKEVLSIHISSAMSGTVQSAQTAAGLVDGVSVHVEDSRCASAPLGMIVIEAARAAQRGASIAELRSLVSNLSVRARVYFTVDNLDYLVRGGRIGRARALLGKVSGIRPILTIEEGMVTAAAKARGSKGILESMVELARPELDGGSGEMLGLVHARCPELAGDVRRTFVDEFGFEDVRVFELGGIVGTHVGPGTWGVSYFKRRPSARGGVAA